MGRCCSGGTSAVPSIGGRRPKRSAARYMPGGTSSTLTEPNVNSVRSVSLRTTAHESGSRLFPGLGGGQAAIVSSNRGASFAGSHDPRDLSSAKRSPNVLQLTMTVADGRAAIGSRSSVTPCERMRNERRNGSHPRPSSRRSAAPSAAPRNRTNAPFRRSAPGSDAATISLPAVVIAIRGNCTPRAFLIATRSASAT